MILIGFLWSQTVPNADNHVFGRAWSVWNETTNANRIHLETGQKETINRPMEDQRTILVKYEWKKVINNSIQCLFKVLIK